MTPTIESVVQFWDKQPCNLHHSQEQIGTKKYFSEVSARKYFVEPHIPKFADFRAWSGKRVLEIGCGIGTDAQSFAEAGADYTGIDLSEKSLELARQRFKLFGLTGQFIQGNAEDLRDFLPVQTFDLVYSFGVIHHSPSPEHIVDRVAEYLGPEGEFRLMLYARNSWKDIMVQAGLDQTEAQAGCPIARTYSPEEAIFLLHRYRIVSMEQTHIFPYVIEDYLNHQYHHQPWFRVMPKETFEALEKRLGWHLLIKAKNR